MRITEQHLRQIIKEALLRETYFPKVSSVGAVQSALNAALFVNASSSPPPLVVDNQWGDATEAAWDAFVEMFYKPADFEKDGVVGPSIAEVQADWIAVAPELGYSGDPDGALRFINSIIDKHPGERRSADPSGRALPRRARGDAINLARPIARGLFQRGAVTRYDVSSDFGPRSSPGGFGSTNHQGIDIPTEVGTQVYAVSQGTVIEAVTNNASAGTFVTIDHEDDYYSRYLHLSQMNVRVGDHVEVGTLVGLSGGKPGAWGSGHSTGPHLHFEVWVGGPPGSSSGRAIDPLPLLTREPVSDRMF